MSDNGLRSHLTLVYSASTGRFSSEPKDDTLASKKDVAWQQIELFASERSDTVIYASPKIVDCRVCLSLFRARIFGRFLTFGISRIWHLKVEQERVFSKPS